MLATMVIHLSIRNLNPLFEQESICPRWTIFQFWKRMSSIIFSVLPPNLGVISSFFNMEIVSMSSSLSTQTLSSWTKEFPKMSAYLLICGDMYWRTTFSFLDFITDNVMLDFRCTSVWNTGFLWRLHVALINKVYHCWKNWSISMWHFFCHHEIWSFE